MQSVKIANIKNRIINEEKQVHYWTDEEEVQSLKDLRERLDSATDYIDIHVYSPPSQNLIDAFSQLPENIKYIR